MKSSFVILALFSLGLVCARSSAADTSLVCAPFQDCEHDSTVKGFFGAEKVTLKNEQTYFLMRLVLQKDGIYYCELGYELHASYQLGCALYCTHRPLTAMTLCTYYVHVLCSYILTSKLVAFLYSALEGSTYTFNDHAYMGTSIRLLSVKC